MQQGLRGVPVTQEGMPAAGKSSRRGLEVEEIEPGDSVRPCAC